MGNRKRALELSSFPSLVVKEIASMKSKSGFAEQIIL